MRWLIVCSQAVLVPLLLETCGSLTEATRPVTATASEQAYRSDSEDFETILEYFVPLSKDLLRDQESFIPMGAAVAADSTFVPILIQDESLTEPEVAMRTIDVLDLMRRDGIQLEGQPTRDLVAAGVLIDVLTDVPGRSGKTDAVKVVLEDVTGRAVAYVLPYTRDADGSLTFLNAYFLEQSATIFSDE